MRLCLALLVPLSLLAACSSSRPLPVASGPVRQLNVGHWLPNTNDLTTPPDRTGT
jgi:hypothetical protein